MQVGQLSKTQISRYVRSGKVTMDGISLAQMAVENCQTDIFDINSDRRFYNPMSGSRINAAQGELLANKDKYLSKINKRYKFVPSSGDQQVCPETALYWLTMNTKNRVVSDPRVLKLAEAMLKGQWTNTGDPITFCTEDNGKTHYIISGQARLWAGWVSNQTVEHTIRFTKDTRVAGNIDTGKTRSIGDLLSSRNLPKHQVLGGVVNVIRAYHEFDPPFMNAPNWNSVPKFLPNDILEYIERNPQIIDTVVDGFPEILQCRRMMKSPVWASALHYLTQEKEGKTDQFLSFWEDLETGIGLEQGDPVLTLREYLLKDLGSSKKIDRLAMAAVVVKAWNQRKEGRYGMVLRWLPMRSEAFPSIE